MSKTSHLEIPLVCRTSVSFGVTVLAFESSNLEFGVSPRLRVVFRVAYRMVLGDNSL